LKLSEKALTGFGSLPEPRFELLFAMALEVAFCGQRDPYLCITRDIT
jgi:hypothetical protein